jgi:hypothetical protein
MHAQTEEVLDERVGIAIIAQGCEMLLWGLVVAGDDGHGSGGFGYISK